MVTSIRCLWRRDPNSEKNLFNDLLQEEERVN